MIRYIKLAYKQYQLVKKIEKALGFKLYPWQIEYILTGSQASRPIGRLTGATTAYIIRMLLDEATPLLITQRRIEGNITTDRPDDRMYDTCFNHYVALMWDKLNEGGVKIRPLEFDWKDFSRRCWDERMKFIKEDGSDKYEL